MLDGGGRVDGAALARGAGAAEGQAGEGFGNEVRALRVGAGRDAVAAEQDVQGDEGADDVVPGAEGGGDAVGDAGAGEAGEEVRMGARGFGYAVGGEPGEGVAEDDGGRGEGGVAAQAVEVGTCEGAWLHAGSLPEKDEGTNVRAGCIQVSCA